MDRILYVHVGPSKTGTSAIQALLRAHDDSVVLYPKVGLWADGSHHNLVLSFFRETGRPEAVAADVQTSFAHIAAAAQATQANVLVSSEVLAGRKNAADFVDRLLANLGQAFRVEILFVVRDHLERAASVYNQRVKDGFFCERRDPDEFLAEHAPKLCYERPLRRFLRTRHSVRVLSFHPANDFVERFLRLIGFPSASIGSAPVRNVSLSTKALVATLAANRATLCSAARDASVQAIRAMRDAFAPSGMIFGKDAINVAEEVFARDRGFLRRRFGVELPGSSSQPMQISVPFALNEDQFAEIAEALASDPNGPAICELARGFVRADVGQGAALSP